MEQGELYYRCIPPTGSSGPEPPLPGIKNFLHASHMCARLNLKLGNVIGRILVFVHCLLDSWVVGRMTDWRGSEHK